MALRVLLYMEQESVTIADLTNHCSFVPSTNVHHGAGNPGIYTIRTSTIQSYSAGPGSCPARPFNKEGMFSLLIFVECIRFLLRAHVHVF